MLLVLIVPQISEGIVDTAEEDGCHVYIGMAGVAAALPGVLASMTPKPVIGAPSEVKSFAIAF